MTSGQPTGGVGAKYLARGGAASRTAGGHSPLQVTTDLAHKELMRLAESVFADLEEHLFDAANQADDHVRQSLLLDAMRKIRLRRRQILAAFSEQISGAHRQLASEENQAGNRPVKALAAVKADELALQSDGEAALSAAKSMIVNRTRVRFKKEIGTLSASIASLKDRQNDADSCNPLDAGLLIDALSKALFQLNLDSVVQICVLEYFNEVLLRELVEIYRKCLVCLENLGVAIVSGSPEKGRALPSAETSFQELQKRLRRSQTDVIGDNPGPIAAGGASAEVREALLPDRLSMSQVEYFKQVQQPAEFADSQWPHLGEFLMAIPAAQGGFRNADAEQQDTLELVSALFEQVFQDPDISLAAKNLIARLQFPILTVAIEDRSFFDDVDHPARQFLNSLARDGIGWPSTMPLLNRHRAFQVADALVQRIIDSLPCQASQFGDALRLWRDAAAKQSARVESAERRISETAVGQARLEAARRIVQRQINRSAGLILPDLLIDFIHDRLFQLMVLVCIKHGTESDEWREILGAFITLTQACGRRADELRRAEDTQAMVDPFVRGLERFGCVEQGDASMFARMSLDIERHLEAIHSGTPESTLPDSAELKPIRVVDGKESKYLQTHGVEKVTKTGKRNFTANYDIGLRTHHQSLDRRCAGF